MVFMVVVGLGKRAGPCLFVCLLVCLLVCRCIKMHSILTLQDDDARNRSRTVSFLSCFRREETRQE